MIPFARIAKYGNIAPIPSSIIQEMRSGQNHNGLLTTSGDLWVQGLSAAIASGGSSADTVFYKLASHNVRVFDCAFNTTIFITTSNRVYIAGVGSNIIGTGVNITAWTDWTTNFSSIDIPNIKSIHITADGCMLLMNNGSVYARGKNTLFATGVGNTAAWTNIASNITKISTGLQFTHMIDATKRLYCCGNGTNGQLGSGSTSNATTLTLIRNDVDDVWGSYSNTFIRMGNDVYCCGNRASGVFGDGSNSGTTAVFTKVFTSVNGDGIVFGVSFLFGSGSAFIDNGKLMVTGINAAIGTGGLSKTTWTVSNAVIEPKNLVLMANGIIVNDGTEIYGAGNSRLLPGLGDGKIFNTYQKCVMPE